jgi:hypothetical protein
MNSRDRARTSVSIGSNQLSKRSTAISAAGCKESGFVVMLVMAWSPVQRFNAGWFEVEHPGDYATLNSYQLRDGTSGLRQTRNLTPPIGQYNKQYLIVPIGVGTPRRFPRAPVLPGPKQSADIIDERADCARRQPATDQNQHDSRIQAGERLPVGEMNVGHGRCSWPVGFDATQ